MMRNRSFMFGLGLGLIIGAVLLQLMIIGEGQTSNMENVTDVILTKEQIQEKAEELDLKVVESSEELLTKEEWTQMKIEESSKLQGTTTVKPEVSEPTVVPDEPSVPDKPIEQNTTLDVVSPKEPKVDRTETQTHKKMDYKIDKGSNLTDVAVGLEKIGVISNSNQFIKEATKQKVNTKILDGNYTFVQGESFESIISKIRIGSSR
ncbi:hypothetical protein [Paenibacillus crassostreae]|uniref:Uncharacterized protein n=1 Tax=Paenibacillus crassostreae TaxID=1763538 RepID=A0A167FMK6_9BACL|nr:hypothetical protein [Paenibacillus crassostreae]AOZ94250.1 hypothetical protein LPB68_19985 [Paenibacillus crassostreae]OAB76714.1 hypothetical protein PNBC_04755 [Paenibacillus crassostreae]